MPVQSALETSGPGCLFIAFAVAAVIYLARSCHRIQQLRDLEQLHGCKKPPNESDRFRYDFFGIAKAIELAFSFRTRTSLRYTNVLFQKYGETYTSNVLGYRLLFTCSAENTKHLLSTAFVDFDSSPLRKPLFKPITPQGIFTLDGADWKTSREQLRSRLSNLRKAIDLTLCEQHFQAFCQHVPSNGQVFDIQSRFFALSLDIQTSFSLGESVDALSLTQSLEKEQFLKHLLLVKERIVQDGFRGPLRHLSSKRKFLQSCKRAREYVVVRAIREIERRNNMEGKPGKKGASKSDSSSVTDEISQLTDQSLSILLANDSMSTTLSGLFFCLSQDARVVRKLRASILDTIGLTPPTWEQLGRLHYIRWVLQEGTRSPLRLYPPVVLNARVANKNSTLPNGGGSDGNSPVLVMKGDIVVFSTWARHRLGEDFGDKPETFYPERWEHLSGDMAGFIPFNKGPRICPGQQYAMIVLTYVVARMFQTFSTVFNYNPGPWKERISMTFENENGVLVGLS
ncbi:cytochrome P450 monooxygenase afumB [Aspergillus ibericus CBS 121593]|uniref:Cytochrome P450 n=1 Tax=Aspergillus ibericus CBS 121593 TaxID=1448316 RepID=A0A395GVG6_9EURO|nr:cytochrome P450 [Aspergillus ibericus CBS 121593]RAK98677.1 cytochrome P450 [Aspergillus ibericus CBS 121593]